MIKSNGGSGYVRNVLFENFQSKGTAYGLNIQQYWDRMDRADGDGVQLTNITFKVSILHILHPDTCSLSTL